MSCRSIQSYLNKMCQRKVRTRRCVAVNEKNRIKRIIFAKLCIDLETENRKKTRLKVSGSVKVVGLYW